MEELSEGAIDEIQSRPDFVLPLECDLSLTMSLVAGLQLALRHPGVQGSVAATHWRHVVDTIISAMEDNGFPEIAALMRMGNNPAHDRKEG